MISSIVRPASSTSVVPDCTRASAVSISSLISFAAADKRCGGVRTSPAPTAKLRPCSHSVRVHCNWLRSGSSTHSSRTSAARTAAASRSHRVPLHASGDRLSVCTRNSNGDASRPLFRAPDRMSCRRRADGLDAMSGRRTDLVPSAGARPARRTRASARHKTGRIRPLHR
jgi:hypothetical protein